MQEQTAHPEPAALYPDDDPQEGASPTAATPPWDIVEQPGPVMVTAIHAGHTIRPSLRPWLELGAQERLREEDPLTDYFLPAGDTIFRANRSRFEFDLNRPTETAVTTDPDNTWGLKVWDPAMPEAEKERSRELHRRFYEWAASRVEAMIERHGRILVLDIHSYNHRRDGREAGPADQAGNPDIDLGATTLDRSIFGGLHDAIAEGLRSRPLGGRTPDVRTNVRWEDGGNFPEWLHAQYGEAACVMTLEYKKVFMDEWGREADIIALQELRDGFLAAIERARGWLRDNPASGRAGASA
jgi:hypothetical protein